MPPVPEAPEDPITLSVFVVDLMSTEAIHDHGRAYALRGGQPPKAFGTIAVEACEAQHLSVDRNDHEGDNPPLHADVLGWPTEKSAQKLIALELASESKLHVA